MKELEDSKETQLSVIDKNVTHHEGNLLSDVEEYPNVDKDERDEEGCSDDHGILFLKKVSRDLKKTPKITLEWILYLGGFKIRKFQLVSK